MRIVFYGLKDELAPGFAAGDGSLKIEKCLLFWCWVAGLGWSVGWVRFGFGVVVVGVGWSLVGGVVGGLGLVSFLAGPGSAARHSPFLIRFERVRAF